MKRTRSMPRRRWINWGWREGSVSLITAAGALAAAGAKAGAQCDPATLFAGATVIEPGSVNPRDIGVGDFNGDGAMDIAVTSAAGTGFISIMLGDAAGGFSAPRLFPLGIGGRPNGISIGDVNLDGKLDIACANENGLRLVAMLLGNGDGTFGSPMHTPIDSQDCRQTAIADMNGDGKPDLLAAEVNLDRIRVFWGNGDGSFSTGPTLLGGRESETFAVADLDLDGALDLVVSNVAANDVSVIRGDGLGGFSPQVRYPTGQGPRRPTIADFNGDGRPDIAVPNLFDGDVSVLLGLGGVTFAPQSRFPAGDFPARVGVADFTADGALDLVVSNSESDDLSLLVGVGDGRFASDLRFALGDNPFDSAVFDANGDGALDVVVSNAFSEDLSLLLNTCVPPVTITRQPSSILVDNPGALVELTVEATGAEPLSYQWRRDGIDLENGPRVSGATTSRLVLFATPPDEGLYDCVVTGALGEATSDAAIVAVRPNPCPADFDLDGELTFFDFLAFQTSFAGGCP